MTVPSEHPLDFIRQIVADDLKAGKHGGRVQTRFPPEPNGYLHIGHAKAICLSFGIAQEFGGKCNLRFDDTNPLAEEQEYVDSMKEDIRWLGFDWEDRLFFASDYFDTLWEWALHLIREGNAYVDSESVESIRAARGTITEPGTNSPFRERPIEESLDLAERMKRGEFEEGAHVIRAKIDMASPNLNLRDPIMYRILRAKHHRTGDKWCVYPMYDFAHGQSDAIEGITHSLCSLEFENHRPLYDWFVQHLPVPHSPRQIEFARLNLTHTIVTKRKLRPLVESKVVDGWDDPRMPTLRALRRRGFPPSAIRLFCEKVGVAKANSVSELALLEACVREELNLKAERRMAVMDPIKLVVTNYPEGQSEEMDAINNPNDPDQKTRKVPFSKELWIERSDYMADAPRKYFRLSEGREVRLRYGYLVTCTGAVKNEAGEVTEVHCTYDPATTGGNAPDGRKVKGTIHWVSISHALEAEVRLYETLFKDEAPDASGDLESQINPESLSVNRNAKLERSLGEVTPDMPLQFERIGFFCADSKDHKPNNLVFNRTVSLKDTYARQQKKPPTPKGSKTPRKPKPPRND